MIDNFSKVWFENEFKEILLAIAKLQERLWTLHREFAKLCESERERVHGIEDELRYENLRQHIEIDEKLGTCYAQYPVHDLLDLVAKILGKKESEREKNDL